MKIGVIEFEENEEEDPIIDKISCYYYNYRQ